MGYRQATQTSGAPGAVGSREAVWEGVSEFLASLTCRTWRDWGPTVRPRMPDHEGLGGVGSPGASVEGGEAGIRSPA